MCMHVHVAMHVCVHLLCHDSPIYSSISTMQLHFPSSPVIEHDHCMCTTPWVRLAAQCLAFA